MKYNVLVLMSTYNGEKYLRQQIDSILKQQDVTVKLLVRDDGSNDKTIAILDEYNAKGQLDYYQGENMGPARSFMHLLQNAPTSKYYAFADQDDVWLPEKLSVAINSLKEHEYEPALYFCQTQLVDENLNKKESVIIHPYMTFGESLVYKYVSGCSMVINDVLRHLVVTTQPSYLHMHDAWIYLIAQAMNAYVFFDECPHILYRQHTSNAVGLGGGFVKEWKLRLHRLLFLKNDRYNQALELKKSHGELLNKENKCLLDDFLCGKNSFRKRLGLMFNSSLRCPDKTTQALFWVNLILNKY